MGAAASVTELPGHAIAGRKHCSEHDALSTPLPTHAAPVAVGAGDEHVRVRDREPDTVTVALPGHSPPHGDHVDHSDQPPFTTTPAAHGFVLHARVSTRLPVHC